MPIATLAAGAIGIGKTLGVDFGGVAGFVSGIFGGGGKTYEDCGSKQRAVEKEVRKYLSAEDIQKLLNYAQKNVGEIAGRSVKDFAFHYVGGDDCTVTSGQGKKWVKRVDRLFSKRKKEKLNKSASSKNTGVKKSGIGGLNQSGVGGFNPLKLVLLFGGAGIVIYLINQ